MDMNDDFTLYERLAASIQLQIQAGALRPGDRVPSVRHFSRAREVSVSTVLQAYRKLEDDGVIEARPQSGYYVRHRARRLPEPAISDPPRQAQSVGISALVRLALDHSNRPDNVPLATANPGPSLFPTAKLQRLISAAARRHPLLAATYSFRLGHPELRHQIARRALDWGCELDPAEIIVTNGCLEALNLALRSVAGPGDTIALESPAYYGLLQIIESLGLKALEIPTHPRDGLSVDAFDFAGRGMAIKACVVVSNVSNPLGSVLPEREKKTPGGARSRTRHHAHRGRHLQRPLRRRRAAQTMQELRCRGQCHPLFLIHEDTCARAAHRLDGARPPPSANRDAQVHQQSGHHGDSASEHRRISCWRRL